MQNLAILTKKTTCGVILGNTSNAKTGNTSKKDHLRGVILGNISNAKTGNAHKKDHLATGGGDR